MELNADGASEFGSLPLLLTSEGAILQAVLDEPVVSRIGNDQEVSITTEEPFGFSKTLPPVILVE
jgi:hypothetical protein